jgi:7-carboxy-7-deazaguanine synthase (Cx14CxxC type)
MSYVVKEIYFTLQGEGAQTGRPAVFLRFAGCNLWSGLERHREGADCDFCDTDFVGTDGPGGGKFKRPEDLAGKVADLWPGEDRAEVPPLVVCTGGEPLLQLDQPLIAALHTCEFEIAVETNGTLEAPQGIDWLTVSPKIGNPLQQFSGDELKLVYPQEGGDPEPFEKLDFGAYFLQPMDGPARRENTLKTISYCAAHPIWQLSLQAHKYLGIP